MLLVDEHSPTGQVWFVDILARILTRARRFSCLRLNSRHVKQYISVASSLILAFLTWIYSLREAIERSTRNLQCIQSACHSSVASQKTRPM